MSDEHELHHLHAFLPRLASQMPELVESLAEEDKPVGGRVTAAWVRSIPPRTRLAICRDWVTRAAETIRTEDSRVFRVLAASLLFPGEFAVADLLGVLGANSVPECSDVAAALARFEEVGLLIHSRPRSLYVVPFPVRLSYEGESPLAAAERVEMESRFIAWCAGIARALPEAPASPREAGWQFTNMLGAYELATQRAEGASTPELDNALVLFGEKLGRAASRRATDEGATLLEASIAAAERLSAHQPRIDALLLLGRFWLERGQPERGLDAYRRCLDASHAASDARGIALAASALAFVLRDRGEREAAIAQFRVACRAANQGGMEQQARDIANCAATLLVRMGRAMEARRWLEELAPVSDGEESPSPAESETLLLLARACVDSGDGRGGESVLNRAITRARTAGQLGLEARATLARARLRHSLSEPDPAYEDARRALGMFDQLGNEQGIGDAALILARVARSRGETSEARRWIDASLTRAWAIRDPLTIARLHEERAELFLANNDSTRAVAELCLARDEARTSGDARYLAHLHMRLSAISAERGEGAGSIAEALRAQGIARADSWSDGVAAADEFVEAARAAAGEELFEQIVSEVSEELESGMLLPLPRSLGQARKRDA